MGLTSEHGLWRKNSKGRPGWSDVLLKWEVGPIGKEKQLVLHSQVDVGDERSKLMWVNFMPNPRASI
jgi:hypothetical protein